MPRPWVGLADAYIPFGTGTPSRVIAALSFAIALCAPNCNITWPAPISRPSTVRSSELKVTVVLRIVGAGRLPLVLVLAFGLPRFAIVATFYVVSPPLSHLL